ncbi:MAG: lipid-A-disaccharide synthase [Rhizobiales bacterium]|nr:lipid-A-disaccharide synthase [Hyphomicrobiales bacterium]
MRIALVIGEESGDQLGAALIAAIRRLRPEASFVGLAGERMQALGMDTLFPISDVAVMGLGSVLAHLPRIARRGYRTVAAVLGAEPDVLVIIDSPGFTHAVAKRVARRRPDLPIIDYVSPSVWAWRPGRAARMARYVDHVLALLPFEPAAHARLGGPPCTYVGHPLIERLGELRPAPGERRSLGGPLILVLPGSRQTEISRLMKPFGEAVRLIAAARPDVELLLPAVPHLHEELMARSGMWPVQPTIVLGEAAKFAAFRRAHAALAASGTVTLELGLAGVPAVVAYRVDPVARVLKRFLNVPSIVLTNLVLGENVVPEFLDEDGSPEVLARETLALLDEGPARTAQLRALNRLEQQMSVSAPPSELAARIVVEAAEHGAGRRAAMLQRRPEIGT